MLGVTLGGFRGMMRRVVRVSVRDLRVVRGRGVITSVMMLLCLTMVLGRVIVMLGSLAMMLHCMLRHVDLRGRPRLRERTTNVCSVAFESARYQHSTVSLEYQSDIVTGV